MFFDTKLTLEQQLAQIDKVVADIPGEAPSGVDFRSTSEGREKISEIESLFKQALTVERKYDEYMLLPDENLPVPPQPRWSDFISGAVQFIEGSSKDLLLATLVLEAAVREYGIRGLRLGLVLIQKLVEKWPQVFPQTVQASPDGRSRRFAAWRYAYDWSSRLYPKLDRVFRITSAGTTFADISISKSLDDPLLGSAQREERISKGAKTMDTVRSEVRQKEVFFQSNYKDLLASQEVIKELETIARAKCVSDEEGAEPVFVPDFGELGRELTLLISTMKSIAWPGLLVEEAPKAAEGEAAAAADGAAPAAGGVVFSVVQGQLSREAAFAQLQQLANFFRNSEPHSPISYAIEQAIRWGKLSLPELLTELIADQPARQTLFLRTGLPESRDAQN